LYVILVAMAWGYTQVFTGRAAFIHLGAFTATIMSANVFLIIIPNQKIVVADLKAGRTPAAHLGAQAKQRSLHNNYLTLPVIFLMGVLIQHYFHSMHARNGNPQWTWGLTAVLFVIIMWLSTVPEVLTGERKISAAEERFVTSTHFPAVRDTVLGRCAMCHADETAYEGIHIAPKNVKFDSDTDIAAYAREIYVQAGRSH